MPSVRLRRGREFAIGNYRLRLEDCNAREALLHVDREDGMPLAADEINYRPRRIPPKHVDYRPPAD